MIEHITSFLSYPLT